jgi:hypothetical protein
MVDSRKDESILLKEYQCKRVRRSIVKSSACHFRVDSRNF